MDIQQAAIEMEQAARRMQVARKEHERLTSLVALAEEAQKVGNERHRQASLEYGEAHRKWLDTVKERI
jgi:hypothetical protein